MDIVAASAAYERWMAQQIDPVSHDLKHKHARMAESALVFLRGTFYRWTQLWPEACRSLAKAPSVPSVGDLHVENFGTWRDTEGRLVWGVNDVDEACELPYTSDLVRLATSALLATRHGHFDLTVREACSSILDGYATAIDRGGAPFVLEERRRWLRQIALNKRRDPKTFWQRLEDCPTAIGRIPQAVLKHALPDPKLAHRVVQRVAGVGSLGRRRLVALARWRGARIAREAKAWLPSAVVWSAGRAARPVDGVALLDRAVRDPDPFFAIEKGWIVRRLAPECSRIELEDLPKARDEERLLRAMGWEAANIHLGRRRQEIAADLKRRPPRWLDEASVLMADLVERDWREWTKRAG